MKYTPTLSSAITFGNANNIEEWIHLFLCGEGDNLPFSEGLKLQPRRYHPPKLFPLNALKRCCGPEEGIKWQIDEKSFNSNVNAIIKRYQKGDWDMPPLIVRSDANEYELNDGNHRYEALVRLGIKEYWVIFWNPDV